MNTVERIVSCYFQMVRGCLTASDVKVEGGNNRQFDLLAANLKSGARFHVEASVTHEQNWCPTPQQVANRFKEKFFGVPKPKDGENTDHAKGKTYLPQIKRAYEAHGFDFQTLHRVWVCWVVKDGEPEKVIEALRGISRQYGVSEPGCELLSLRDHVIPELTECIGTSNYDDDVLRILSLLEQRREQAEAAETKARKAALVAAKRVAARSK